MSLVLLNSDLTAVYTQLLYKTYLNLTEYLCDIIQFPYLLKCKRTDNNLTDIHIQQLISSSIIPRISPIRRIAYQSSSCAT